MHKPKRWREITERQTEVGRERSLRQGMVVLRNMTQRLRRKRYSREFKTQETKGPLRDKKRGIERL